MFVLANAGLVLGSRGLLDAYERASTTEIANDSLREMRPDIVHQCLLAIFDSEIAFQGRAKVFIETTRGKTIMVNPRLRPPRTYVRFKGLMEMLFRDGKITSENGEVLLSFLRGSVAPVIPYGAEVIGLCNERTAPVKRPIDIAEQCIKNPVPDSLQGGQKRCYAFFVVGCNDDASTIGIPLISQTVCLSPYPTTPHVLLSRMCEAFQDGFKKVKEQE